ncbi:hypothetical protein [Pseudomonas sp.]|uniref:hypothetical protein n=1 Tax=Pseudomonas sp. TaxID=306 RepID=UPI003D1263A4
MELIASQDTMKIGSRVAIYRRPMVLTVSGKWCAVAPVLWTPVYTKPAWLSAQTHDSRNHAPHS